MTGEPGARLTDRAKEELRPGEALVFDWHRLAICCAAAGEVSLRRTSEAKADSRTSWFPGLAAASAVVVALWGWFLYAGVTNPLGGINQLFPLFGIANQLLAAVALTVATTILIKSGRLKWAWVTAIPLAWDATVTLTASAYKVFSVNDKVGFFEQWRNYRKAIDAGEILPPAKTMDDMQSIVNNSLVDGILAAFFAIMVIVVIADAARIWIKVIRTREPLATTETPPEPSRIWAPSGLFPTPAERAAMRARTPAAAGGFGRGAK